MSILNIDERKSDNSMNASRFFKKVRKMQNILPFILFDVQLTKEFFVQTKMNFTSQVGKINQLHDISRRNLIE